MHTIAVHIGEIYAQGRGFKTSWHSNKASVGFVPSLRVHLMEPDFLLTACRFPSRVDTNSKLSGRETVVALQNPCTKQINRNYYDEIRRKMVHDSGIRRVGRGETLGCVPLMPPFPINTL